MRARHSVCISGIGAITPFANGWQNVFAAATTALPAYSPWNADQDPPCAEARLGLIREYARERYFNERQLRLMDRAMSLSSTAVGLALEDADLALGEDAGAGDEVAILMASMRGELPSLYRFGGPLFRESNGVLNPALFPTIARNISCGQAAIRFGLRGWSTMISAGEISGAHALARAQGLVASGRTTVAVAGAFEVLSPISLHHIRARSRKYGREHLFATPSNDHVPTEGACFFVLESLQCALARGCRPYAILDAALHGYLPAGKDDAVDPLLQRHAHGRNARHDDIDLLLTGTAQASAEAILEERLLQVLRQHASPRLSELRPRRVFGDAGSLTALFQTAVAAQLLSDAPGIGGGCMADVAKPNDQATYSSALTTALTDRGAWCMSSLQRVGTQ